MKGHLGSQGGGTMYGRDFVLGENKNRLNSHRKKRVEPRTAYFRGKCTSGTPVIESRMTMWNS